MPKNKKLTVVIEDGFVVAVFDENTNYSFEVVDLDIQDDDCVICGDGALDTKAMSVKSRLPDGGKYLRLTTFCNKCGWNDNMSSTSLAFRNLLNRNKEKRTK